MKGTYLDCSILVLGIVTYYIMLDISTLSPVLGTPQDSRECTEFLLALGASRPMVATYPDGTFHNHHPQGLSLFYTTTLDRIDFYNPSPTGRRRKPSPYSPPPDLLFKFPSTTIPVPPPPPRDPKLPPLKTTPPTSIPRPAQLVVTTTTTAKELVECFGEPVKKGGTTAWIDTYVEWEVDLLDPDGNEVKLGVMVELREGPGEGVELWDRAKNWEWACFKVFHPTH
jgi:hypothetical protein